MPRALDTLRLLDQVQHLPQLDAFDGRRFIGGVANEVAELGGVTWDELAEQLDAIGGVLGAVDRFAQKSMGIRMNLALAHAPAQLRTLLVGTVVSYDDKLPLLRQRAADALARIDRATAPVVTDEVMAAAERVLGDRAALRAGLFEIAQRTANARLPAVQALTRDRTLTEEQRRRWGQARLDLEALSARPAILATGSFAERIQKIPPPPDEPEPESTASRFSLLEID